MSSMMIPAALNAQMFMLIRDVYFEADCISATTLAELQ